MAKRKMLQAEDFRGMTSEELDAKLEDLRRELYLAKGRRKDPKLDVPFERYRARKEIARLLTVVKEKQSQIVLTK